MYFYLCQPNVRNAVIIIHVRVARHISVIVNGLTLNQDNKSPEIKETSKKIRFRKRNLFWINIKKYDLLKICL